MNKQAQKYFETSNKIEGVLDIKETELALSFTDKACTEETLLDFHEQMGHLNDYCIAGEYRTYPIFVGNKEGVHYSEIKTRVDNLFKEVSYLKDFEQIKYWHRSFEEVHPFGDGNGRTGRLLMWLQCRDAVCLDELYKEFEWQTMEEAMLEKGLATQFIPFDAMRQNYYQWFI
jgi:fido (protein-threonine AMPylation protein)